MYPYQISMQSNLVLINLIVVTFINITKMLSTPLELFYYIFSLLPCFLMEKVNHFLKKFAQITYIYMIH
jgi:hypothetical protein